MNATTRTPCNAQTLREALPFLNAREQKVAQGFLETWARRRLSDAQYRWAVDMIKHADEARVKPAAVEASTAETVRIDGVEGVAALLNRARGHLKAPNIVLTNMRRNAVTGEVERIPGMPDALRIGWDKDGDKLIVRLNETWVPGHYVYGVGYVKRKRAYLGRIFDDGKYEPHTRNGVDMAVVIERLRTLAADPVNVAKEHAKLTGRCCFCNTKLEDERSTAAGYGYVCAHHYGLPWGERPVEFAAPSESMTMARTARED